MPTKPSRRRRARRLAAVAMLAAASAAAGAADDHERPAPLKSGIAFASADVRSMQGDDFANPGMLWVTRGEALWRTPEGAQRKACADCHQRAEDSMKGVATRYPAHDARTGRVLNLDGRINACRTRHQEASPWADESDSLLAMSAYVAHQSRGMPVEGRVPDTLQASFERGRERFHRRIGQMNLACVQCHQRNWGRTLLAQTISQGHGNAYPAYRLEWQTVGSLQRRLRACYFGVRAQMPDYGAPELVELEVYLAWRGRGLPIETPGVRR